MEPRAIIDAIEAAPTRREASAIIRRSRQTPGLSQEFFSRVLGHFVSDPRSAARLAALWQPMHRHGDDPALALRSKGVYLRFSGRWRESANAFIAAGSAAANRRDRLAFQAGAVDALARAGDVDRAVRLGSELINGLEAMDERVQAARIRLNVGNSLMWQDRNAEARSWFEAAIPVLEEAQLSAEKLSAKVGLSTSHLYSGDLSLARSLASEAKEEALELGFTHLGDLCDLNIANEALLSGRADEALDILVDLRERLKDSPADHARCTEFQADAFFRLNLWPEAIDAFYEALPIAPTPMNKAGVRLGLGQTLSLSGAFDDAIVELRRARTAFARLKSPPWAAYAMAREAECLLGQGRNRLAFSRARRAYEIASSSGGRYQSAEAALVWATAALEIGEAIEQPVGIAERLIRDNGYQALAWKADYLRAKASKGAERRRHFRRMFAGILAQRLLTSSLTSRASFLRDKSAAIQDYISELMRRPSRATIREVRSIIERSRSIALLDEILVAHEAALSDPAREELQGLRTSLQQHQESPERPGQTRSGVSPVALASIQRRWIAATHMLRAPESKIFPPAHTDCVMFAEAKNALWAVGADRVTRLEFTPRDLEERLRWLYFELLEPMANPEVKSESVCFQLQELGQALISPWIGSREGSQPISVEGSLWRVPWAACMAELGLVTEPIHCLHPSMNAHLDARLPNSPKALLWLNEAEDLKFASDEAGAFLSRFPDTIVCSTLSSAVESLNGAYDLLHVVSHARHSVCNPMFSAIYFGDGALYAADIARSGLSVGLVTLSACETANLTSPWNAEPDGLARAFLARKAKAVVGSAWPLDDQAAQLMGKEIFAALVRGETVGEAVRRARLAAQAWRSHPYYWGSLTLFGGYR